MGPTDANIVDFRSSLNRNSGLNLQENSIRYSVYSKSRSYFTNVDVQTVNKAFFLQLNTLVRL